MVLFAVAKITSEHSEWANEKRTWSQLIRNWVCLKIRLYQKCVKTVDFKYFLTGLCILLFAPYRLPSKNGPFGMCSESQTVRFVFADL